MAGRPCSTDRMRDVGLVEQEVRLTCLRLVGWSRPSGVTINSQLLGPWPVRWSMARGSRVSVEPHFLGPVT